ncbi:MAG: hypothetical protein Ct9H300mP18_12750 [Candidatus Neomarinimicrobiota bacterium]|nr:MAG: hypothetical protein Ct9H300mP18_12750 [Candidatus Neomarinimicrobiota bacterium]
MNQQRQVVYDLRKQALNDKDISESIEDMLDDYIDDELSRMEEMDPQHWDWDNIKQNFSSHLLVDIILGNQFKVQIKTRMLLLRILEILL